MMDTTTLLGMHALQRKERWYGQHSILLPNEITTLCSHTPTISTLYITALGFYSKSHYHYQEYATGISQITLIYCLKGCGWVELPTGHYSISSNQYLIIPSDVPYTYGSDNKNPWTIYWFHFNGTQSNYFFDLLGRQSKDGISETIFIEERQKIFDSIYQNLEQGFSLDNLLYANISFQYYLTSFIYSKQFVAASNVAEKDLIDLSIEYMQNHLHQSVSLESLASFINVSSSHYSCSFKKKTGYSPIVYFNHLKIQRACELLQFTSLRIGEIASELGIEDTYYFSRLFSKVMGMSPLGYRKKKLSKGTNSDGTQSIMKTIVPSEHVIMKVANY
jgi:AraC-like DNA-binding protein